MRRSGQPSRPNATTCSRFAALKTLLIRPRELISRGRVNVPKRSRPLAGFQLSTNGRFWVSTEGRPTAGHEHDTEIRRYPTSADAAAAYAEARGDLPAIVLEDLPAAYGERPFHIMRGCSGLDCGLIRELVWQLGCWVVESRSSDDTHFILTLDPIELSRAIVASAGDLLRADCVGALAPTAPRS